MTGETVKDDYAAGDDYTPEACRGYPIAFFYKYWYCINLNKIGFARFDLVLGPHNNKNILYRPTFIFIKSIFLGLRNLNDTLLKTQNWGFYDHF